MSGDNKTEKATPKRREEARKKGQVVKSSDVNTAVVLFACVGALMATGGMLLRGSSDVLRHGLAQTANPSLVSRGGISDLALSSMRSIATLACVKVDTAGAAERRRIVSAAKLKIADACRHVSQESVQLHGGMGMTAELKVSHTFRRLTAIAQQFGDADHHLERYAHH